MSYDLSKRTFDADFTNFSSYQDVSFWDVPVSSTGEFRGVYGAKMIEGALYGPSYHEAAGIFETSELVGAFGGKKRN